MKNRRAATLLAAAGTLVALAALSATDHSAARDASPQAGGGHGAFADSGVMGFGEGHRVVTSSQTGGSTFTVEAKGGVSG